MARNKAPHWIKHTHVFDPDEYECPVCGQRFPDTFLSCPACNTHIAGISDPQDWVDEMEMLDIILGDD